MTRNERESHVARLLHQDVNVVRDEMKSFFVRYGSLSAQAMQEVAMSPHLDSLMSNALQLFHQGGSSVEWMVYCG